MSQLPWNERYAARDIPWNSGEADPRLVSFVEGGRVAPGRALEIGCGTGTNSIWLAQRGFDVLGMDLAALAVDEARAKAAGHGRVRFEVGDFLATAPPGEYDFVFDRGCWHVFDEPADRARFATHVAEVLAPGAMWLSLIGSTEGDRRDAGPPRRSARDIADAIEPVLQIVGLSTYDWDVPIGPVKAWACLSRRRTTPAAPSSRRG